MRGVIMLAVLFGLATLIGISEGILFFKFGTFSPCEALSTQVFRIHEQARSELGLPRSIGMDLIPGLLEQLQHAMRQALGIPDPDTPFQCVFALGKIFADYQRSVERAKTMWRAEAEAQRAQR